MKNLKRIDIIAVFDILGKPNINDGCREVEESDEEKRDKMREEEVKGEI